MWAGTARSRSPPEGQPAMTYQDVSRWILKYAERTPFAAP